MSGQSRRTLLGTLLLAGTMAFASRATPARASDRIGRIWRAKCASCHGDDGKGATEQGRKMSIVDLTDAAWQSRTTDDRLRKQIDDGVDEVHDGVKKQMDPFRDQISAEQIDDLVQFVRHFAPSGVAPSSTPSPGPAASTSPPPAPRPTVTPAARVVVASAPAASKEPGKTEPAGDSYSAYVRTYSAKTHQVTVVLPVARSVDAKSLRRGRHVRLELDPKTGAVVRVEVPRAAKKAPRGKPKSARK